AENERERRGSHAVFGSRLAENPRSRATSHQAAPGEDRTRVHEPGVQRNRCSPRSKVTLPGYPVMTTRAPLEPEFVASLAALLGDRFSTGLPAREHHGRDESIFPAMPPD